MKNKCEECNKDLKVPSWKYCNDCDGDVKVKDNKKLSNKKSKMYICTRCGSITFQKGRLCGMCREGNPPEGADEDPTTPIIDG